MHNFVFFFYLQYNVKAICSVCKIQSVTPGGAGYGVNDRSS